MKRIFLFLLSIIFYNTHAQQMSTKYAFVSGTGASIVPIVNGTQLIGANADDIVSVSYNLPTVFYFNGIGYNSFKVTPNGILILGTNSIQFPFSGPLLNYDQRPLFAPYLSDAHTTATGHVMGVYDVNNDAYIVQWQTAIPFTNLSPNSTFQLHLSFVDYSIKFIYGNCANASDGAVGIFEDAGFYSSVNVITNTATSDSVLGVINVAPQSGTFYSWTPVINPLFAGNVGIGTSAPTANLDIKGVIRIRGGNASQGKVLTSDNNGEASWQALPQPTSILPSVATINNTLRFNGTSWVEASGLKVDGSNNIIISNNLKLPLNAGVNKILTSDTAGNASWQVPMNNNWTLNSTNLTSNNTGNIGIGIVGAPSQKLDVGGAIKIGTTNINTKGSIRYNSTDSSFEAYDNSKWKGIVNNVSVKGAYSNGSAPYFSSMVRNLYVELPYLRDTIKKSGTYLVILTAKGLGFDEYNDLYDNTDNRFDNGGKLRVCPPNSLGNFCFLQKEIFYTKYGNTSGSAVSYDYISDDGEKSAIVYLNAGDIIKTFAYITQLIGANAPPQVNAWYTNAQVKFVFLN
jgi:hypothetical protein